MKITVVSPAFKTADAADISNYHPISVLPCFSKTPECAMYCCLYKCSAEHATAQPIG